MAIIKCHECGNEISSDAKTCPKCGVTPKTSRNKITFIIGVMIVIFFIWFWLGGGLEQQTAKEMGRIENQVADDAVKQYEIAKRNGNPMDTCIHAMTVSAAYLQAKDEVNYQTWGKIQKSDCVKAGMP